MIGKLLKILFGFFLILALIVLGGGLYFYTTFLSAPIVDAQVRGSVLVNGTAATTPTTEVKEGDTIATENGRAALILQESVIVIMEPRSKIVVEDTSSSSLKIKQESGSTWNHVTKLNGVDSYTLMEGENVATVTGTAFQVSKDKLLTFEGTVSYAIKGKNFSVVQGKAVENINGNVIERPLNPGERAARKFALVQAIQELRFVREREIAKYPELIKQVKDQFKITDAQITARLLDSDTGKISIDQMTQKVPAALLNLPVAERVIELTKEIQRLVKLSIT